MGHCWSNLHQGDHNIHIHLHTINLIAAIVAGNYKILKISNNDCSHPRKFRVIWPIPQLNFSSMIEISYPEDLNQDSSRIYHDLTNLVHAFMV